MTTRADAEWRSAARDAGTKTAQPSPAPVAQAGGSPLPGERGKGRVGPLSTLGVLRPFCPVSWFHPRGILKVLKRLRPRLPDVSGSLFLTFTINPLLFADPSAAFEHSRQQLRRVFYRLRKGAKWKGKKHVIDEPYCVKVEFHGNEWAHFHVIFLTRRFIPGDLLNELWGLGRTNVRRITNERFHYLLKYVTKGGGPLPEWVRNRTLLRVFQASRGFYVGPSKKAKPATTPVRRKRRQCSDTVGERIERQQRTAVLENKGRISQVMLAAPFEEIHAEEIYPAAADGRYLGGGHYQINDMENLIVWIKKQNQPKPTP